MQDVQQQELMGPLVEIWQSVLGRSPVTVDDDFFAMGGDSLRAIQIVLRLEERLKVSVTLQELFERPTIRLLSQHLPPPQSGAVEVIRVVPRGAPPPASDMQEVHLARLTDWKLLPLTHPQQNICVGYRIRGPLHEAALQESVVWLCQRHEVLRTYFDVSTQPPTQIIQDVATVDYTVIDLQDPDEKRREARVAQCVDELKQQPFNCLEAPVIRFHLLRVAPLEAIFIITTCHLIMDAWSVGLLQEELADCYGRLLRQEAPDATPVPVQYADFAIWQRAFYPKKAQQTLAYWHRVTKDFKSLGLHIPLCRPRPEKFEYRTAVELRDISALHAAVRAHCERHRLTAFSFYMSAFVLLLHKLSQKTSMLVFTPSAQRNRIELERMMGRFSRSLLLRVEIDPQLAFGQFVNQVTNLYLQAQSNLEIWNVTFNSLLPEMVYGEEDRTRPLSYVAFSFEQLKGLQLQDLEVESFPIKTASGPWFDLNVRVFVHRKHTRFNLTYNPDSYTPEISRFIADTYETMIRAALADDQLTLGALADAAH